MRPPFCRSRTEEKYIFPLYKPGKACYNILVKKLCTGGSMDRASDSGSEGWGFESLPVYQKSRYPSGYLLFCIWEERTRKIKCGADERHSRGLDRAKP